MTGWNASSEPAIDIPMLRRVNVSEAAVKTATASAPAASARSIPLMLGTSTG